MKIKDTFILFGLTLSVSLAYNLQWESFPKCILLINSALVSKKYILEQDLRKSGKLAVILRDPHLTRFVVQPGASMKRMLCGDVKSAQPVTHISEPVVVAGCLPLTCRWEPKTS